MAAASLTKTGSRTLTVEENLRTSYRPIALCKRRYRKAKFGCSNTATLRSQRGHRIVCETNSSASTS